MPKRIKGAFERFRNRMIRDFFLAVAVGLSVNFVYEFFTFKPTAGGPSRFSDERIIQYGQKIVELFQSPVRLEVMFFAALIFAFVRSGPIYFLDRKIISPTQAIVQKADEDDSWSAYFNSIHIRVIYQVSILLHAMMFSWTGIVMYTAFNPLKPLSWLKFKQYVKEPYVTVTTPENYPWIILAFLSAGILASVYHAKLKPIQEAFGHRGGYEKK